jgi:hypothetical protein
LSGMSSGAQSGAHISAMANDSEWVLGKSSQRVNLVKDNSYTRKGGPPTDAKRKTFIRTREPARDSGPIWITTVLMVDGQNANGVR